MSHSADMSHTINYPPAVPVRVDVVDADRMVPWERAMALIFHIVGTVTCCVFLYLVYVAYVALGEMQDRLQHISDTFGVVGG